MAERIRTITEIQDCLRGGDHFAIIPTSPKTMYRVCSKSALAELYSFARSEGLELQVIAGEEYLNMFYVFSLVMFHTESGRLIHEQGTLFCHSVMEGRKTLEELYFSDDPMWSIPGINFFKI